MSLWTSSMLTCGISWWIASRRRTPTSLMSHHSTVSYILSKWKDMNYERLHNLTKETLQVFVFPCFSFLLCFELGAEVVAGSTNPFSRSFQVQEWTSTFWAETWQGSRPHRGSWFGGEAEKRQEVAPKFSVSHLRVAWWFTFPVCDRKRWRDFVKSSRGLKKRTTSWPDSWRCGSVSFICFTLWSM